MIDHVAIEQAAARGVNSTSNTVITGRSTGRVSDTGGPASYRTTYGIVEPSEPGTRPVHSVEISVSFHTTGLPSFHLSSPIAK